jgi:glycosyltransferase involved in cell wall biosynthesis
MGMRVLVFANRVQNAKLSVRESHIHKHLQVNGVKVIYIYNFYYRSLNFEMLVNYLKLFYCFLTKKKDDLILIANDRSVSFLSFFKKIGFKLAIDIIDNRALQRLAYKVDDSPENIAFLQKLLLKNIDICDYVFPVSQSCKELYPEKYHSKIYVIENAANPLWLKYSNLPEELSIGFVSGIAPGRGIEFLIKAGEIIKEKVPGLKLYIAGTPSKESKQYYEKLKNRYESSWISFFDDISYSVNINQFISKCYLMVIPNPDHIYFQTTLHLKLFDSLACGRPVVSTNCKETARILNTYHCGLVSDFTEQDFAGKITQLLMNRDEASIMGKNGRRIVEDIYNWDNMARKIINCTG